MVIGFCRYNLKICFLPTGLCFQKISQCFHTCFKAFAAFLQILLCITESIFSKFDLQFSFIQNIIVSCNFGLQSYYKKVKCGKI